jgi:hypothetical protein
MKKGEHLCSPFLDHDYASIRLLSKRANVRRVIEDSAWVPSCILHQSTGQKMKLLRFHLSPCGRGRRAATGEGYQNRLQRATPSCHNLSIAKQILISPKL